MIYFHSSSILVISYMKKNADVIFELYFVYSACTLLVSNFVIDNSLYMYTDEDDRTSEDHQLVLI